MSKNEKRWKTNNMRKLTENEINEMTRRCLGLERKEALIEGGRYLCEIGVVNWTSTDVETIIFRSSKKRTESGQ